MNQDFTINISDEKGVVQAIIVSGEKQLILETAPLCESEEMNARMRLMLFTQMVEALRARCYPADVSYQSTEPEYPEEPTIPDGPPCG